MSLRITKCTISVRIQKALYVGLLFVAIGSQSAFANKAHAQQNFTPQFTVLTQSDDSVQFHVTGNLVWVAQIPANFVASTTSLFLELDTNGQPFNHNQQGITVEISCEDPTGFTNATEWQLGAESDGKVFTFGHFVQIPQVFYGSGVTEASSTCGVQIALNGSISAFYTAGTNLPNSNWIISGSGSSAGLSFPFFLLAGADFAPNPNTTVANFNSSLSSTTISVNCNNYFATSTSIFAEAAGYVAQGACAAVSYLFLPTTDTTAIALTNINNTINTIKLKPPFGYFTGITNAFTNATTSSTTLYVVGLTEVGNIFAPFRLAFEGILWLVFGIWIFNRIRRWEFQA